MHKKETLGELNSRLRHANEHLVVAAMGAYALQSKTAKTMQQQQEFLGILAHQLRDPLAPIAMATSLLKTLTGTHPQLPAIQAILARQLGHLTHLIDDLADAARLSGNRMTLQGDCVALAEVIDRAVEVSRPFMERQAQHLQLVLPQQPVLITGDLLRLTQVFANLLNNASRFTQRGGHITLSVQRAAPLPGAGEQVRSGPIQGGTVTVVVRDDGIGIAAALQPFIFDLFQQGPGPLEQSRPGLGIGLAVVRTIVELHGGTVTVHSEGTGPQQVRGSQFCVVLPERITP